MATLALRNRVALAGKLAERCRVCESCSLLERDCKDLRWINVVREPVKRWSSLFYYEVDVSLRGQRAAIELNRARIPDVDVLGSSLSASKCVTITTAH